MLPKKGIVFPNAEDLGPYRPAIAYALKCRAGVHPSGRQNHHGVDWRRGADRQELACRDQRSERPTSGRTDPAFR